MKSARALLVMFIIGGYFMSCSKEELIPATPVTDMQKLMAEKAFKLPGENNPIMAHKYGADPAVLEYNDTLYVYTTNDMQQLEFSKGKIDNGYNKITSLNVFSTKDLVNWTDCGEISVAGRNNTTGAARWASNSWAPAIAYKKIDGKDKFFLYFADSGNGIGVLEGESPVGPFIDPLKAPLISRDTPTCAKINWLFDPAVIVDEKGDGYLYFGGGHDPDKYEHPMNARCVALVFKRPQRIFRSHISDNRNRHLIRILCILSVLPVCTVGVIPGVPNLIDSRILKKERSIYHHRLADNVNHIISKCNAAGIFRMFVFIRIVATAKVKVTVTLFINKNGRVKKPVDTCTGWSLT